MSELRYGRRPPRPPEQRFKIAYLHDYAPEDFPAPDGPVDVSRGIEEWGMLGNGPDPSMPADFQPLGDCGVAGYEHERMLAGATPTSEETVNVYLKYTNGQDVGVVVADFLAYLRRHGAIEAFAPVHPAMADAVMAKLGRGLLYGVLLPDDADQVFGEGGEWTSEDPNPESGHVILKVKSDPDTYVTWGAEQTATEGWTGACTEEVWAIVTKDDMSAEGYAALVADLELIPDASVATSGRHGWLPKD